MVPQSLQIHSTAPIFHICYRFLNWPGGMRVALRIRPPPAWGAAGRAWIEVLNLMQYLSPLIPRRSRTLRFSPTLDPKVALFTLQNRDLFSNPAFCTPGRPLASIVATSVPKTLQKGALFGVRASPKSSFSRKRPTCDPLRLCSPNTVSCTPL